MEVEEQIIELYGEFSNIALTTAEAILPLPK